MKRTLNMTGEQSRQLKVGDRVRWDKKTTDRGTVVEVTWSGVTIKWENGHTESIAHNDMTKVERALTNLE
jgi:hypothetical protein